MSGVSVRLLVPTNVQSKPTPLQNIIMLLHNIVLSHKISYADDTNGI